MIASHRNNGINGHSSAKWFSSPVVRRDGPTLTLRESIPDVERQCLALPQSHVPLSRINPRLDMIIRKPLPEDDHFVPLGVVSKEYQLVQHKEVFDAAVQALRDCQIDPSRTAADLTLTEHGERMQLSIFLPGKYAFEPGDGNPMSMRLECFNSVDGSTRLTVFVGWFRFVCSNGLIIGVTRTKFQRRHTGDLSIADIGAVLKNGFEDAETDKENFEKWRRRRISPGQLVPWVEQCVAKEWGFKAATRTYHIAKSGHDVEIIEGYTHKTPTTIAIKEIRRVPGAPKQASDAYDLSQTLAWLAKERRDVQEQLAWRQQIPALMEAVLN